MADERSAVGNNPIKSVQRKTTVKWDEDGELTKIDMVRVIDRLSDRHLKESELKLTSRPFDPGPPDRRPGKFGLSQRPEPLPLCVYERQAAQKSYIFFQRLLDVSVPLHGMSEMDKEPIGYSRAKARP